MAKIFAGTNARKNSSNRNFNANRNKYTEAFKIIQIVGDKGYIVATPLFPSERLKEDQKIHIKIRAEDYERASKSSRYNSSSNDKFVGHIIDDTMAKYFEKKMSKLPDDWDNIMIAINISKVTSLKENGETIDVYECSKIVNVKPSKTPQIVKHLISVGGYIDHDKGLLIGKQVYDWRAEVPQSYSVDDKAAIKKFKAEFDESYQNWKEENNETAPMALMLSVLIPNPNYDPSDYSNRQKYLAIYNSMPDGYDKDTKENMNGERFEQKIKDFKEDVIEFWGDTYPDMQIEFAVASVRPISSYFSDAQLKLSQTGSPIYQMIKNMCGFSAEQANEEKITSGASYVWGGTAILFAPNVVQKKIIEDDGTEGYIKIPSNMAMKFWPTGSMYHIRTKMLTSDGSYCQIHDGLKRIPDENLSFETSADTYETNSQGDLLDTDEHDNEHTLENKQVKASDIETSASVDDIDDDIPF